MEAVFRIRNDAGRIQLDERSPALSIHAKPPLVASPVVYERANSAAISYDYDLDQFPLLAIKPIGNAAAFMQLLAIPNGVKGYQLATSSGLQTVASYVFQRPTILPPTGAGWVLRDAAGALTFSSAQAPMRIAAVLQTGGGEWPTGSFTGEPGHSYAVVYPGYIGGWRWDEATSIMVGNQLRPVPDGETWYQANGYAAAVQQDPDVPHRLLLTELQHSGPRYGTTQTPGATVSWNGTAFVVDVTGL